MMKKQLVRSVTSAAIFSSFIAVSAFADIASDRKEAREEVIEIVEEMAKDLKNAWQPSQKFRPINKSKGHLRALGKAIEKYEELAEGDNSMEREASKMEAALKPLGKTYEHLTRARSLWEIVENLEESCEKEYDGLVETVESLQEDEEAYEESPDAIMDAVEESYEKVDEMVGDADLRLSGVKNRVREVKKFRAPDDWDALKRMFDSEGDKMVKHLTGVMKAAHKVCDPILKGVRQDFVVVALDEIEDQQEAKADFLDKGGDWLKGTQKVFNTSCRAKQKIHSIAAAIDWESDKPDTRALDREISSQKSDIVREIGKYIGDYKTLQREADRLDYDDEVSDLHSKMRVRLAWFAYVKKKGVMFVGARHPMIRKNLDYGVDMHDRLQGARGCDLSETKVGGTNKRLDCFDADQCLILEFKPKTHTGSGLQQAKFYADNLADDFSKIIKKAIEIEEDEGTTDPDDPRPKLDTIKKVSGSFPLTEVYEKMLKVSNCIKDDGSVSIKYKLDLYDPYDADAQLRCDDPLNKY